jgi:hypothetical protein
VTIKDGSGDFLEKLTFLRENREKYISETLKEFALEGEVLVADFEKIIASVNVQKEVNSKITKFVIYWMKSTTRGRLTHKGPYVQLKYKIITSGLWNETHLGSLINITKTTLKEKAGIGYRDISEQSIASLLEIKQQFESLAPKINRVNKVLKLYKIKLIHGHDASWASHLGRMKDAIHVIGEVMSADLANMVKQELTLDLDMLRFNQAMRRRYRSFFIKWNINPSTKKSSMGPAAAAMYIVTTYTSNKRFVKPVKQFKQSLVEDGSTGVNRNKPFSPWVTYRLLRVGRATTLRKRLMGLQTSIKGPLSLWEDSYNRLLTASTNIKQL